MARIRKKITGLEFLLTEVSKELTNAAFGRRSKVAKSINRITKATIKNFFIPDTFQDFKQLEESIPAKNQLYAGEKGIKIANGVEYYPPKKGTQQ